MFRMKTFFASFCLAVGLSTAVCAATLTGSISGDKFFEIYFEDDNTNGKLDLSEFTGWQGFSAYAGFEARIPLLLAIGNTPALQPFAVSGGSCTILSNYSFCFQDASGRSAIAPNTNEQWSYSLSTDVSNIPLPAGLPLVLTGLAGFVGVRMWKKRTPQV